jgi:hypothetical protein
MDTIALKRLKFSVPKMVVLVFAILGEKIKKKILAICNHIVYIINCRKRARKLTEQCRGVEQLVARRAHNPKVAGSSPVPATNLGAVV